MRRAGGCPGLMLPDPTLRSNVSAVRLIFPVQESKGNGAGIRDVEALDWARHGKAHYKVAFFARKPPEPLAFGANHERKRLFERRFPQAQLSNRGLAADSPSRRAPRARGRG